MRRTTLTLPPAARRLATRPLAGALGLLALPLVLQGVVSSSAAAQAGVGAGQATAVGAAGATEARGGAAVFWNPALLGIYDGPVSSYQLLLTQAEPATIARALALRDLLGRDVSGTVGVSQRIGDAARAFGADRTGQGRAALTSSVQWIGLQNRGLGLAVQSSVFATPAIPTRAARYLAGDAQALSGAPTAADSAEASRQSRYAAVSTAAVSLANNFGASGKRAWVGATLKASLIHASGRAAVDFLAGTPGGALTPGAEAGVRVQDVRVRQMASYGADLGMALQTSPSTLVSLTAVNVYQQTVGGRRGTNNFDVHTLVLRGAGADGRPSGRAAASSYGADNVPDSLRATSSRLVEGVGFTPAIRSATSVDIAGGRVVVAYTQPFNNRETLDRQSLDRYTVAYVGSGALSPRLSWSRRLSGENAYATGFQLQRCGAALGAGLQYVRVPGGGDGRLGVSAGLSVGNGPCAGARGR